jgi:hypothetical protein
MTDMNDCLPTVEAKKHYVRLSGSRRKKSVETRNAGLANIRQDAAMRGHRRAGKTFSALADLSAASIDELTKGLVEDAIATCNLYDIELTRELCACFEQAAHDHLETQKDFLIQHQSQSLPYEPTQLVQALQSRIEIKKFSVMNDIGVLIERARVEDETRRQALAKSSYKPPKRFAVGAKVRVRNPGLDGIVIQMDDERTSLSEYWHTIQTKYGERKEPGCNLELIPEPITHPKPLDSKIADNIHFHGSNSRLNVNSMDKSTNVASSNQNEVFAALNDKAISISNEMERDKIVAAIAEMENAHTSGGFLTAYQNFMSTAADHITVFAPLMPLLTKLLSDNS